MATKTFTQLTALSGALAAGDEFAVWDDSAAATRRVTVTTLIDAVEANANTFTATQKIMHPSSTTQFHLDAIADQTRYLVFMTAGVARWYIQASTAETGSDAGSDLSILSRTDAGAGIRTAMAIKRSTGYIGLGGLPATSAALDIQATTGALLVPRMTTAQRDALTPTNGMIIYNTTTTTMQGYIAGAWANM